MMPSVSSWLSTRTALAGGVNFTNLKTVFPKFKQVVDFKTRGENMLELVYKNSPEAYNMTLCPRLGCLDHLSVTIVPA